MTVLQKLLDRSAELPAEYRGGLTNHLPMALHALQQLGAPDARLSDFAARYATRFGAMRAAVPAPRRLADWRVHRGDGDAFDALRAHFAAVLAEEGAAAVLTNALPSLWTGMAAAAFHGPIRAAHAVEIGHVGELATALAYWAARWQPVEAIPSSLPPIEFGAWFDRFVEAGASEAIDAPLISASIAKASATAPFRADAACLTEPADPLGTLARAAARLYAESRNFTVLHIVTATRAVRVLSAFAAPSGKALWPAVGAALMAAQVTRREAVTGGSATWADVRAAAIDSDDDRVIKLVHACTEHAAHDPDAAFLDAARRAVS
ncbi:MAG: questin oxidase family protein [Pseudomonadota bacterium]